MTDKQSDKLNMHITTLDYCDANRSVWEHIPVFDGYMVELRELVISAKTIVKNQQGVIVKGATVQKGDAEDMLVEKCIMMSGALYAYGFDVENPVLMESGRMSKHTLYKMRGHSMLAKAKNIADIAAENAEKLVDYGIGEENHKALEEAITAYEALLLLPREAINERKQYTGGLVQVLAAADSVLIDRMDKLAIQFKTANPAFYSGYRDARIVKGGRVGTRPSLKNGEEGAAERENEPLQG